MASSNIRKPFLRLLPIQIAAVTAGIAALNAGIRMIGKLTKKMEYHTDAGVNTLLMVI